MTSGEKKKKIDLNRRDMPKQLSRIRRRNFNEVALGYTAALAVAEAKRCFQCAVRFQIPAAPLPPVPVKTA